MLLKVLLFPFRALWFLLTHLLVPWYLRWLFGMPWWITGVFALIIARVAILEGSETIQARTALAEALASRPLADRGEGVIVSQVVPFPHPAPGAPTLPLVSEFLSDNVLHGGGGPVDLVTFEGYVAGRLTAELLSRIEGEPTRVAFTAAVQAAKDLSLRGFPMSFGHGDSQGSDQVYLTELDGKGGLRTLRVLQLRKQERSEDVAREIARAEGAPSVLVHEPAPESGTVGTLLADDLCVLDMVTVVDEQCAAFPCHDVLGLVEAQCGQVAKAAFFAGRCFQEVGGEDSRDRSSRLFRFVMRNFPNARWAQEAREYNRRNN